MTPAAPSRCSSSPPCSRSSPTATASTASTSPRTATSTPTSASPRVTAASAAPCCLCARTSRSCATPSRHCSSAARDRVHERGAGMDPGKAPVAERRLHPAHRGARLRRGAKALGKDGDRARRPSGLPRVLQHVPLRTPLPHQPARGLLALLPFVALLLWPPAAAPSPLVFPCWRDSGDRRRTPLQVLRALRPVGLALAGLYAALPRRPVRAFLARDSWQVSSPSPSPWRSSRRGSFSIPIRGVWRDFVLRENAGKFDLPRRLSAAAPLGYLEPLEPGPRLSPERGSSRLPRGGALRPRLAASRRGAR